jgi:hypothetical protein
VRVGRAEGPQRRSHGAERRGDIRRQRPDQQREADEEGGQPQGQLDQEDHGRLSGRQPVAQFIFPYRPGDQPEHHGDDPVDQAGEMAAGFAGDDDSADDAHRRGMHQECAGDGRDIADHAGGY